MRYQLYIDPWFNGQWKRVHEASQLLHLDPHNFISGCKFKVWDSLRLRWISADEFNAVSSRTLNIG